MAEITPKENYFRILRGEIPEYIPSMFSEPRSDMVSEELLTPVSAPEGTIVTSLGVEYIGAADLNMGAMPNPRKKLCPDITNWDKYVKKPDLSDRNWEMYYKAQEDKWNRERRSLSIGGGDYFLSVVSFMGYEDTMMAMYEEEDALLELLEYVSDFYIEVMKKQIYYTKPDIFSLMDDDSAYRSPFFSVEMYRKFFKPFQQRHCDLALENGMMLERHDCGRCEQFIDDWLEMGIRGWGPAQTSNDLKAIKEKYTGRLAINGGWDNQGILGSPLVPIDQLKEALVEYVDMLAPGGGFVFGAMIMGDREDPAVQERNQIIKDFYFDYVQDYYKTHK